MNDSSLLDRQGAIHTWLTFNNGNSVTKYFSFENQYAVSIVGIALGQKVGGICAEDNKIKDRTPTESLTIPITEEQYNQLIDASQKFCANPPNYDLQPYPETKHFIQLSIPNDVFNCVTASSKILLAANINILALAFSPREVKERITTGKIEFNTPNKPETVGYVVRNVIKHVANPFSILTDQIG